MVDPSGTCDKESPCVFATHSADVWLAVSGVQSLFTLGWPMFTLFLDYSLSFPLGPSAHIDFFISSKISFGG